MGLFEISIIIILVLVFTIWALTRANAVNAEIKHLQQKPIEQLSQEFKENTVSLWLFVLGGGLLTGGFAVVFYGGGSVDPRTWNFDQWVFITIGLCVTIAITYLQKHLYSSIHTNVAAFFIVLLVLAFVIVSEIATSAERTDEIVRTRSINSEVFKATTGSINNLANSLSQVTPVQKELADENANFQYWLDMKASKNPPYSIEYINKQVALYQKQVDRLNAQVAMQSANQTRVLSATIEQAKKLEYNENNQTVLIRFMKQVSQTTGEISAMFMALILIVAFEAGFHFAGTRHGVLREAISRKGYLIRGKFRPTLYELDQNRPQSYVEPSGAVFTENEVTVHVQSEQSEGGQHNDAIDALQHDFNQAIKNRSIGLCMRDVKQWIANNLKQLSIYKTAIELQDIANQLLNNAVRIGVLTVNPEYQEGNRKPKYMIN